VAASGPRERKPPPFLPGDPIPWFTLPGNSTQVFHIHSVGGHYVVLCFFGSPADAEGRARLEGALAQRRLFDDRKLMLFAICADSAAQRAGTCRDSLPGVRFFFDIDSAVSRRFKPADGMGVTYVLDPTLRVLAALRFDEPKGHDALLAEVLERLPPVDHHAGAELNAPVLLVPRLLEPTLCRALIDAYNAGEREDSGFMREQGGKTVATLDHSFKRRADVRIADVGLRRTLMERVTHRLVPEIAKAFHYRPTRMERYIVACYDAEPGGYFKAHRDNTTKGTAHRRFAVTVNLNAEEYEGGDLRFPEFGSRSYRAPTGGAVVFSCSLLHEALPVTKGKRYAFLPFLYDDAAAKIREANNPYLGEGVLPYAAGPKPGAKPPKA
jgi:peroxiredoxin